VASVQQLPAHIKPTNLNADILEKFDAGFGGNVAKANENWPELVKKSRQIMEIYHAREDSTARGVGNTFSPSQAKRSSLWPLNSSS
jgi:hypothetical protein